MYSPDKTHTESDLTCTKKLDIPRFFEGPPSLFKPVITKESTELQTQPTLVKLPRNKLHLTGNRQAPAPADDALAHGIVAADTDTD